MAAAASLAKIDLFIPIDTGSTAYNGQAFEHGRRLRGDKTSVPKATSCPLEASTPILHTASKIHKKKPLGPIKSRAKTSHPSLR